MPILLNVFSFRNRYLLICGCKHSAFELSPLFMILAFHHTGFEEILAPVFLRLGCERIGHEYLLLAKVTRQAEIVSLSTCLINYPDVSASNIFDKSLQHGRHLGTGGAALRIELNAVSGDQPGVDRPIHGVLRPGRNAS